MKFGLWGMQRLLSMVYYGEWDGTGGYRSRRGTLGPLALITPALFSQPPPLPGGRRGRNIIKDGFLEPSLSCQGGRRAGREGLGSEGPPRGGGIFSRASGPL